MSELDQFIQKANELTKVPLSAATAYYNSLSELTASVDSELESSPNIHDLIGHNPLQIMYDNHKHHGAFMATVFSIGSSSLLARTLPWVYRAYHSHGFSFDYFLLELNTWIQVIERDLAAEHSKPITAIYRWMINQHEAVIVLSMVQDMSDMPVSPDWLEQKNTFLTATLDGDHKTCLELAREIVKSAKDIEDFYMQILQPVLYEVGILWENAQISVAQEHLASAIVNRVMASVNLHIDPPAASCGKAVIAASPNEYHEIGAAMISDLLENEGWKVSYLGANVPEDDLFDYLYQIKPDLLALSVTVAFNITKARDIITRMKNDTVLKGIRTIVGGRVFNDNAELWETVGADACAANVTEAVLLARQWRSVSP